MASRASFLENSRTFFGEGELARRLALASEDYPEQEVGKPRLLRMAAELDIFLEPARRLTRRLDIPKTANPQTIILLPGFGSSPARMRYMAQQLERAGHRTKRWGMGRNWGVAKESMDKLEERLLDVCERYEEPVALVGWSLGGLFARELAKRHPLCVSKVITMGSPFSGSPRANNVWRVYQAVTGHRVDQPPIETVISEKPPVRTVALWSANDGAISPRCASGDAGERDEAVALSCTHCGFIYAPESIFAVLKELDRS